MAIWGTQQGVQQAAGLMRRATTTRRRCWTGGALARLPAVAVRSWVCAVCRLPDSLPPACCYTSCSCFCFGMSACKCATVLTPPAQA